MVTGTATTIVYKLTSGKGLSETDILCVKSSENSKAVTLIFLFDLIFM